MAAFLPPSAGQELVVLRQGESSCSHQWPTEELATMVRELRETSAEQAFACARSLQMMLERSANPDQLYQMIDEVFEQGSDSARALCNVKAASGMLKRLRPHLSRTTALSPHEIEAVYVDLDGADDGSAKRTLTLNRLFFGMCPCTSVVTDTGQRKIGGMVNRFWHYTKNGQKHRGAAEAAGVWLGDRLVRINDQDATSMEYNALYQLLCKLRAERPLTLSFERTARISLEQCVELWSTHQEQYMALLRVCQYCAGLIGADEQILGCWHVMSLNEWESMQPRVIVLCSCSYFRVKFDEAQQSVDKYTKVALDDLVGIEAVQNETPLALDLRTHTENGLMVFCNQNDGFTGTSYAQEWQNLTTPQAVQHPRHQGHFLLPERVGSVRLYYAVPRPGENRDLDIKLGACAMHRAFYEQLAACEATAAAKK